ncbi:38229_t:CDS:10 [Gigaspora margarita]|uniref:38229_t:CDS:1 n=1 Tax=Gigaspora margarita TaxID=4874 RepID=A0ABN7VLP4_GIGMA|nr:38229_t:CDS:10 [Gigaspora margarita]
MSWHIDEIDDYDRAWNHADEGPFDKVTDKFFKSLRTISNTSTDANKVKKTNNLLDNIKGVESSYWLLAKLQLWEEGDRSSSDRAGKNTFGASKGNTSKLAISSIVQAIKHVQHYAGVLSNSAIVNVELASKATEKDIGELPAGEVLTNEITLPSQSHYESDSDYHKQKQRRTKSGRAILNYSDQISEEESSIKGETRKRSKELEDGLCIISENAPCFGLGYNDGLNYHFNREILKIYNNAEQWDPIKMGVIDLEDPRKNQTRPFKVKKMLIEIRSISDVSAAKSFVSKYKELESFEFDIASVIQSFVVSIAHTFTLIANKDSDNDSRTQRGMIPDIKLLFIKRNVEIIVVEHAKNTSSDERKKNIDDTQNIKVLMHNQITKIYKLLKEVEKEDDIKEIEVYGVVTSRLEVNIYVMHLSAPELYPFYKIISFELPKTVCDFDILSNVLSCLIRFRKIVDNNYIRYISILRKDPVTPTQDQMGCEATFNK